MKDIILKHALANAVQFGGKANAGAVIGKVLAENPDLKSDVDAVKRAVSEVVKDVNSWGLEKQKKELEKTGYEKPQKEQRTGLPPLPNVQGKVVMRIAPFPSGPLHIGNAKPFILNDEYVKTYDGKLLLVMDDTIGTEEKMIVSEAYKLIQEGLKWLGVNFDKKVVYRSDRLKIYYEHAEKMIKLGRAYVCECRFDELRKNRMESRECGHRSKGEEENLSDWKKMLKGKYKEGEAVLRIKTDMAHPNPAFRDRVLLRISSRPHPRTKKKYKVWPLLDFAAAIDDHLLGVTHILRGKDLMIESEMEKYLWDIFGWKHSVIIHSGLMRIEGVKLSKSKSQREIASGRYEGWDDPRTWSLQSLRKRGFLPEAIRSFLLESSLTEHDVTIPIENLYAANRKLIDAESQRYFFVAEPVEISIDPPARSAKAPLYPGKKQTRSIPVGRKVFVEKIDFLQHQGKEVRLMHLCNIILGKKSKVTGVRLKEVPKIHWVSNKAVKVKVVMPNGAEINGLAEPALFKVKPGQTVQFERLFFASCNKKGVFYFSHK